MNFKMTAIIDKLITPVVTSVVIGLGGYFVALPVMQRELQYIAHEVTDVKIIIKHNSDEIIKLRERMINVESNIRHLEKK